jgi:hypothetical protein
VAGFLEDGNEPSGSTNSGEFLEWLSSCCPIEDNGEEVCYLDDLEKSYIGGSISFW